MPCVPPNLQVSKAHRQVHLAPLTFKCQSQSICAHQTTFFWRALESSDPDASNGIRTSLKSADPGASNGGSNSIFRHFGADTDAFGVPDDWLKFEILGHPPTSKAAMSAPKCRKVKFDPPLDAQGSALSSALRMNTIRQTRERTTILWTSKKSRSQKKGGKTIHFFIA